MYLQCIQNRNTRIVCYNCKNKKIGEIIKEKIKNNMKF